MAPLPRPMVHPGEILKSEFLDKLDVSTYALAKALPVPANRVTAAEFWLTLQVHHDLEEDHTRLRFDAPLTTPFSERSQRAPA